MCHSHNKIRKMSVQYIECIRSYILVSAILYTLQNSTRKYSQYQWNITQYKTVEK